MLLRWLGRWRQRLAARPECRGCRKICPRPGRRPWLEVLEDRLLPALTWTSLPDLPAGVSGLSAATDGQGRIYAIGGNNGSSSTVVERYDPSDPAPGWTSVASLNLTRFDAPALTGADGSIYVFGGHPLSNGSESPSVERYDPVGNTWTNVAPMLISRYYLGAAASAGSFYALGGVELSNGTVYSSMERYDPGSDTWSTTTGAGANLPNMGTPRQRFAAATDAAGHIYALGGSEALGGTSLASVEEYDPASNTWTNVASMLTPRQAFVAVTGPDGLIYVLGGENDDSSGRHTSVSSVDSYDPATNTWTSVGTLSMPRQYLGAAVGTDGRIYDLGGRDVTGGTYSSAEVSSSLEPSPVANPDAFSTAENTPLTLSFADLTGNDLGTGLTPVLGSHATSAAGTIEPNFDSHTFLYTPPAGFTGSDSFTYQDRDVNNTLSNAVTDTVTVLADNTFIVTNTKDSGAGSLRQAIVDADSAPAPATIQFNIPDNDPGHFYYGSDGASRTATTASDDAAIAGIDPDWPHSWWTIAPTSALPALTNSVTIDGYTQPGASPNTNGPGLGNNAVPRVELTGASAGDNADGLQINASGSTVRGLIINSFGADAVLLTAGNNVVEGNFIGTDVSGTAMQGPPGGAGVHIIDGSNNTVGGTAPGAGNTIGFNYLGVQIQQNSAAATGNAVLGNAIFSNTPGLGIDLQPQGNSGVTPNDPGDSDSGPNNLQNFPVLTAVAAAPSVPPVADALLFDGSDDFVAVPGAPSLDVAGAITLEAWINPQTVAVPFGDIISRRTSPTKGDVANYAFRQEDNRLEFYFTANGAFREYFSDPVLVANEWQHVAATFDPSTQQIRFYVDGVLVSVQTTPYTLTTYPDTPLTLGAVWTNATEVFPGALAEVRIWSSARSQSQIVADAARTSSNTDPALVGYWHFDEGSGTTAVDESGNHNDGIFGGGSSAHQPVYVAVAPGSTGGNTVIAGTLNSTPNTTFRLEFFASAAADPTGHGPGQTYLGGASVTTDANTGNASFTVILPVALPAGENIISATATDPAGNTSEFSADINAEQTVALTVNPITLPHATANSAYTATLSATGGSAWYVFAVTAGVLPSWLSLNRNTLAGTPTTAGTSTFTITATDSTGRTGSQTYTLTVNPASKLTVSTLTLPNATANSAYSASLNAAGGSGSYTFAVTAGVLPSGLSLSSNTLSGTPKTAGTSTLTITARDNTGLTGTQTYTLIVGRAPTVADEIKAAQSAAASATALAQQAKAAAASAQATANQASAYSKAAQNVATQANADIQAALSGLSNLALGGKQAAISVNQTGSISGAVFNDLNHDGIREANEPGLAGRTVFLDANNDGMPDTITLHLPSSDTPRAIDADNGPTYSYIPVTVPGTVVEITDVGFGEPGQENSGVVLTNGEIYSLDLTSPAGASMVLICEPSYHYVGTIITDFAPDYANGDGQGIYRPSNIALNDITQSEKLSTFNGAQANGNWQLTVEGFNSATFGSGPHSVGTLYSWGMDMIVQEATVTTDANGNYSFSGLSPGNYVVRAVTPDGWAQTGPPGGSYTVTPDSGQSVIGDFGSRALAPGQLQFSAPSYAVNENGVYAVINVTRTGGSDGAVAVNYATANGTASAGQDFVPASGTLSFNPGETSRVFSVPILDDTLTDGSEVFSLSLSNPTNGATLGTPSTAVVTISDFVPTGGSGNAVSGNHGASGGTAIDGSSNGFQPGSISGTVFNDLNNDSAQETGEAGLAGRTVYIDYNNDGQLDDADYGLSSTDTPRSFSSNTVSSTIQVPSRPLTVAALVVTLDLTAPNALNRLEIDLTSPTGSHIRLAAGLVARDNISGIGLADSATTSITSLAASSDVFFKPTDPLSTFNGAKIGGTWQLTVRQSGADAYTLIGWGLQFRVREASVQTNATGRYTLTGLSQGTYMVREAPPAGWAQTGPASGGYSVTPDSGENVTGKNFGNRTLHPGQLQFSAPTYRVSENGVYALIQVTRTGGSDGAVAVNYATADGTARAGQDYITSSGTVDFNPGETSRVFAVPVLEDGHADGSETVNVTLTKANYGATLGKLSAASLIITDDGEASRGLSAVGPPSQAFNMSMIKYVKSALDSATSAAAAATMAAVNAKTALAASMQAAANATAAQAAAKSAVQAKTKVGGLALATAFAATGAARASDAQSAAQLATAAVTQTVEAAKAASTAAINANSDFTVVRGGTITFTNGSRGSNQTVVPYVDLQVSISPASPNPVTTGQLFSYTVTVTNAGFQNATHVEVDDFLDQGTILSYTQASQGSNVVVSTTANGVLAQFHAGTIAAGASATFMISESSSIAASQHVDNVIATADQPNAAADNAANVSETVAAVSELRLSMSSLATGPVHPGDTYKYTITVSNTGSQDASDVVLDDVATPGEEFIGFGNAAPGSTLVGKAPAPPNDVVADRPPGFIYTIPSLAAGASTTLTVFVRCAHPATYTDTVTNRSDGSVASVAQTVSQPATDLTLSISGSPAPNPAKVNQQFQYTVTVTNAGPAMATNVLVADLFQGELFDGFAAPPGRQVRTLSGETDITIPTLAPGASDTFTFFFHTAQAGDYTDTITVRADQPDAHPDDNAITATVSVTSAL